MVREPALVDEQRARSELDTRAHQQYQLIPRVLERELAKTDWVAAAEPQSAQYDAPWVPGPMRRNEILLPVRRRE